MFILASYGNASANVFILSTFLLYLLIFFLTLVLNHLFIFIDVVRQELSMVTQKNMHLPATRPLPPALRPIKN